MAVKDDIKTAFERSPGQTLLRDPQEFAVNTAEAAGIVAISALLSSSILTHAKGGTITQSALDKVSGTGTGIIGGVAISEASEFARGTLGTGELRLGTAIDNLKNSKDPGDVAIFTEELKNALFASGIKGAAADRIVQRAEADRTAFQSGEQTEEQKQTSLVSENVAAQKAAIKAAEEEATRPRGLFGNRVGETDIRPTETIRAESQEGKTKFLHELATQPSTITKNVAAQQARILEEEKGTPTGVEINLDETEEMKRRRKQRASKTSKTRT